MTEAGEVTPAPPAQGAQSASEKPRSEKSRSERPRSERPRSERPRSERPLPAGQDAEGARSESPDAEGARTGRPASWKVKLAARGFVLLVTLVCLELVSCVGGRVLRSRTVFYEPMTSEGFAEYARVRDPELGWPPLTPRPDRDPSGARVSPAFPDHTAKPCISVYGDSFAWGDEADNEHAWANVLAKRVGCRVSNQGVVGYGSDQALLRLRRMKDDPAKVALLGFPTENIHRNVNTFRGLISPKTAFGFKPRFLVTDDGKLELVPMLKPETAEEYDRISKNPAEHLRHEYFAPGGPSGMSTLSFPHLVSVLGLAKNFRIRAALRGEPAHAAFFSPEHDSRGLQVTAAIGKAFADEAASRGGWGAVVIIPLGSDFEYRKKHGKAAHQPLVDALTAASVPVLDLTDRYLAELNGKDPCSLFTRCKGGHFTEEGYRLLAEYVHDWLKEQGRL